MGNNKDKPSIWVRLKRVLRRVKVPPQRGDGGAYTDKYIEITKPQTDSSFVVKDTAVVARPRN